MNTERSRSGVVSPELEAIWEKHAGHIAWSRPWSPTASSDIEIDSEVFIRALSPRIRRKRSQILPTDTPPPSPQTPQGPRENVSPTGKDDVDDTGRKSDIYLETPKPTPVDTVVGSDRRDASSGDGGKAGDGIPLQEDTASTDLGVDTDVLARLRAKAQDRGVERLLDSETKAKSVSGKMESNSNNSKLATNTVSVATAAPTRPFLDSHAGRTVSSLFEPTSPDPFCAQSSSVEGKAPRICIGGATCDGSSFMSHSLVLNTNRASAASDRMSFIDMMSPQDTHFDMSNTLPATPVRATLAESLHATHVSGTRSRSCSPKPPIPTSRKPNFARSSPQLSLKKTDSPPRTLPPTTNYLQPDTRADLVRKSRKLTQVFGQPPGAGAMPRQNSFLDMPVGPKAGHLRQALSVSATPGFQQPIMERRHSTPLTPADFDDESIAEHSKPRALKRDSSPHASFMDLSDSEQDDTPSLLDIGPPSPATQSMFENMSPQEQQEELRRRKREKLAKLHRFLGSRVPTNLVLGLQDSVVSLPPLPPPSDNETEVPEDRRNWLRRRRSSSFAAFPAWSDDHDRVKENLDDHEKAINVRRAQKMEKVFGVAPPQTLYHTRLATASTTDIPRKENTRPLNSHSSSAQRSLEPKLSSNKGKGSRPSTADSSRPLLNNESEDELSMLPSCRGRRGSVVYTHYQQSLNSLVDIIDRDDCESLAELHQYINTPLPVSCSTESCASIRSERRRSLPTRTSSTSLASQYSLGESIMLSPKVQVSDFQLRRRRAAKLTAFFGVDYRVVIHDVMDSIENGLLHERKRGTLEPEEAADLLKRLREIKTKRDGLF